MATSSQTDLCEAPSSQVCPVVPGGAEGQVWENAARILLEGALQLTGGRYAFIWLAAPNPVFLIRPRADIGRVEGGEGHHPLAPASGDREFEVLAEQFHALLSERLSEGAELGLSTGQETPLRDSDGTTLSLRIAPLARDTKWIGCLGIVRGTGEDAERDAPVLEVLAQLASLLLESATRQQADALLREQLQQSQKLEAIGRLAGGLAHDFNNMLAVIQGYGDLLLSQLESTHPLRAAAGEIVKAAARSAVLTRQLLAFSRKQSLSPQVLCLDDVIRDFLTILRRLLGEDVQLIVDLRASDVLVSVDPGKLEQVLMNLVVNARDAMPLGGTVHIATYGNVPGVEGSETREPEPCVLLRVTDTGCGIDPAHLSRIFEPFFTTKQPGEGTGLGLSVVLGIVQQSGGTVRVKSEPGLGTTFEVYLPAVTGAPRSTAAPEEPEAASTGSETLLLVEDEPMVRGLVADILRSSGYNIVEAESPSQAVELCKEHRGPLHLLLTDVVMPEMSGREMAEEIRKLQPDVRVVYMSGYVDECLLRHGVRPMEVPFLQKPFSAAALCGTIRQVLEGNHPSLRPEGNGFTETRQTLTLCGTVRNSDGIPTS